jgi:hypothetical protein
MRPLRIDSAETLGAGLKPPSRLGAGIPATTSHETCSSGKSQFQGCTQENNNHTTRNNPFDGIVGVPEHWALFHQEA